MKNRILIPFFALAAFHCHAINQDFVTLHEFMQQSKTLSGLPSGTSIALIKGDKIVYQGQFGLSDIAANKPVTANTVFYVASTTKPFYALSTLLDIHHNKLKASDTLSDLFIGDTFAHLDKSTLSQVTVKDLLVHGSGIGNNNLVWASAYTGLHDLALRKQLLLNHTKPLSTPYGTYDYDNFGYNVISIWSDLTQAKTWQDTLADNVFKPLKMTHTTSIMSAARSQQWDVAKPYSLLNDPSSQALYLEKVDNTMHSAGGMVTTAHDMAQLVIAELNQGKVDGQQIFPPEVIAASQVKQISHARQSLGFTQDGYAWGWHTGQYKAQAIRYHHGGFAGSHALISYMPEAKVGVVILNNEDHISRQITEAAASMAYDLLLENKISQEAQQAALNKISEKVAQLPLMLAKHKDKIKARPWLLTLEKPLYAGHYSHPQLGTIYIELDEEGQFQLSWGQLKTTANGFTQPDSMRVEFAMFSGAGLEFNVKENSVLSLTFDDNTFIKGQ